MAQLGLDEFPGKPNGDLGGLSAWNDSIRLPRAHRWTLGAGQRVCVKEQFRPDVTTALEPLGEIANPSSLGTSSHVRFTAGIIRNNDLPTEPFNSVAPEASVYIANWDGYTGSGGINEWCRSRSTKTLSYSWSVAGTAASTASGVDFAHDWIAVNSPWILGE